MTHLLQRGAHTQRTWRLPFLWLGPGLLLLAAHFAAAPVRAQTPTSGLRPAEVLAVGTLARPVSSTGRGANATSVTRSVGWDSVLDCDFGYVNGGGYDGGAGDSWIQVGSGGSVGRWGDFNADGVTGDLRVCGLDGQCVDIYFDNTLVCEVVTCDNPVNDGTFGPGGGGDDDCRRPDCDTSDCTGPDCDREGCSGPDCSPVRDGTFGNGGGCRGPDCDTPPTCLAITVVNGESVSCDVSCNGEATGAPACLDVRRHPYPRGLVSVPNLFVVRGPFVEQGSNAGCADPPGEFPLHTNREVRVDFHMRTDIPPAWKFDERPWNVVRGVPADGFGLIVEHTYETASYSTAAGDKAYNGPSLTEELLPSYQVRVDTWWTPVLHREWDQYYWHIEYEEQDVCVDRDAAGNCTRSERQDVEVSREYRFSGRQVVEEPLDLRAFSWPTADLFSRHAWDSRQDPLPPYTCQIIPTPILEAQALLTPLATGPSATVP